MRLSPSPPVGFNRDILRYAVEPPERIGALDAGAILQALRRQWSVILAVAVPIILAAAMYLWLTKPEYTATARLIIDPRSLKVLNIDNALPALDGETSTIESQLEVLRSRRIAERVLHSHRALFHSLTQGGNPQEEILESVMKRLKVERRGLSHIIDVSYRDENRAIAANTVNAFVDEYLADQAEVKQRAARQARSWLQAQVEKTSEMLRIAEERAEHHRVETGLVDSGEMKLGERELTDFTNQLVQARVVAAAAAAKALQIEQWAKTPEQLTSLSLALNSELVLDLRRQMVESQRKIASITSRFGEQHPAALEAKAEMETIVTNIRQEFERLAMKARSDAELARTQVALMEQDLETLKRKYAERKLAAISHEMLDREVEASREFRALLLKRLNETQAQENLHSSDVRVVAYAEPPLKPSSPRRFLLMASATLGALLLGVFVALVVDARATSR